MNALTSFYFVFQEIIVNFQITKINCLVKRSIYGPDISLNIYVYIVVLALSLVPANLSSQL